MSESSKSGISTSEPAGSKPVASLRIAEPLKSLEALLKALDLRSEENVIAELNQHEKPSQDLQNSLDEVYQTQVELRERAAKLLQRAREESQNLRLQAESLRQKSLWFDSALQALESSLVRRLQDARKSHVEGMTLALARVQNPLRVDQVDMKVLPREYVTEKTIIELKPDKRKILAAFNEGKDIPGVTFARTERLEIKEL